MFDKLRNSQGFEEAVRESEAHPSLVSGNRFAHAMPFGAQVLAGGGVRFSLWAPPQNGVRIVIEGLPEPLAMEARPAGWHMLEVPEAREGSRYQFLLENGACVPDPASRYQPDDVHGFSEVVDPHAYVWKNASWRGRAWHECVCYELHVGTFTPDGTFRSAIQKLDWLAKLGVTAIELMPVADFPGKYSWGYDAVLLFAPDSNYGRPQDLKAFVDAAHEQGIMVFLDVVYNHFGPEGNFLPSYAPEIYDDRHPTPWGPAINFDGSGSRTVRGLIIHNALYWLEEYRFDGLRLDAVHAIKDDSPTHILEELAERVRAWAGSERMVHLVVENYSNESRFLIRTQENKPRWYTAQWNDDLHHGLHVAATHENEGYYSDYAGDLWKLGRALAEGFSYQGEPSKFAGDKRRGEPSAFLPPLAFVSFIQNHDQIGNRAFGE
ncbi:MAG: malto-oligosyltrehalose trehalohydrolase, partial [Candidatus Acidiferrum sp.]